ncbi:TIGR01213 family protein [Allomyces macrogynus ATCC 38327]|uniref:tRNA pseudouridine(55) synthase n=1 Tax=Allomyces macrogynus (strain ATCC 38327) TaxID=578462 RepID=A0A0L0SQC2_ALLM3|nr:TIGR01213 family protein [Allomyces macrogynus ATCC 38327]|eukprot:KNE64748.1 TIGR01213 family protein [Allomyces macrogynus ATCC 38327]
MAMVPLVTSEMDPAPAPTSTPVAPPAAHEYSMPAVPAAMGPLCTLCATGLRLSFLEDLLTPSSCTHCLGVLPHAESLARALAETVRDEVVAYDAPSFAVEIMLPRALAGRHTAYVERAGGYIAFEVRKEFAKRAVPVMEEVLGKRYSTEGPLRLLLAITHAETDAPIAARAAEARRPAKRGRFEGRGKADPPAASQPERLPFPPSTPTTLPIVGACTVRRDPIYLGGRYLKLERHISQTLWRIKGQRKTELSVAECVSFGVADMTQCDAEIGFLSAGREDADVRMLGTGRPFVLEVRNARKVDGIDPVALAERANKEFAGKVQVSRMCVVNKDEVKQVKEGEELKAKEYTCLVWAPGVDQRKVDEINALPAFQIDQHTPLRVLHRRPNLMRPKTVHWIRMTPLNDGQGPLYRVTLETQAGAYIKEFIMGDTGRTRPSLSSLLGTHADILELDVTKVALEWPPARTADASTA